jgi:glutathione S-transferase
MKLYFSPLACSLATRIALYEAGADAVFDEVDPKTKLTSSGRDFHEVHPLALVPALELADGEVLSETAAVLQYVARRYPDARLAPTDERGIARLQQWLCFIGTELHKSLFTPLLVEAAGPDAKSYAMSLNASRLSWLAGYLHEREFLLDHFTVADAYLLAILNWSAATPVDLTPWPALVDYQARLRLRPSVDRAFREEIALYQRQRARHARDEPVTILDTRVVIERFNSAFLRHEPALLDELVAEDCVLENTTPAPLGARYVGREACLSLWRGIAQNRDAHFELEEVQVRGDHAQICWRYYWGASEAESVRGVNLMRVRAGKIVEGRGYVKGS